MLVSMQPAIISFDLDWQHGQHDLQRLSMQIYRRQLSFAMSDKLALNFIHDLMPSVERMNIRFTNAETRQPLYRLSSWHVRKPLDIEKMSEAARKLVGEHDFATFGQPPQGMNSVRHVYTAEWRRQNQFWSLELQRMHSCTAWCVVSLGR